MLSPDRRTAIEFDLHTARRRAAEYLPFSPAWDAAMAMVEDLERMLWLLDGVSAGRAPMGRGLIGWRSLESTGSNPST